MPNRAKAQSTKDGKTFLKERFIDVEKVFVTKLKADQRAITHDGALGDTTEDSWIELLQRYLPSRYKVAKAFAVDHLGNTTQQLDCLIFDAHFTPALFGKDKNLYVPAEAVYATFEIKQTANATHLKAAAKKVASLRALQRTSVPLTYGKKQNPAKKPFPIIGGLISMNASWKGGLGSAFLTQFDSLKKEKSLDLVLTAEHGFCDHLTPANEREVVTGPGSLLRGLFRLLDSLRSRASVVAIDWKKYEAVFED
jgi:hypothetical protein